jgi:hypothetical protein
LKDPTNKKVAKDVLTGQTKVPITLLNKFGDLKSFQEN